MKMQNINLTVDQLYSSCGDKLKFKLLSGKKGLDNLITKDKVQKIGLRMIKPELKLDKGKIQILGLTEISYFKELNKIQQDELSTALTLSEIPCFVITKGIIPPLSFKRNCDKYNIPLFKTSFSTAKTISTLNSLLDESLAPYMSVHGVLLDIHRLGVLILGKSGVGKSECALDLILKGSKLVADDLVKIRNIDNTRLIGTGPDNIKHLIEIRGIGIINIKNLVGSASVMDKKDIDIVIELEQWNPETEYDRIGDSQLKYNILDIELPYIKIPVSPGRNLDTIVEIAVRNHIFRSSNLN